MIIDTFLLTLNLWSIFHLICISAPVEAPYKRKLVETQYKVESRLRSIPFYTLGVPAVLLGLMIHFYYEYYYQRETALIDVERNLLRLLAAVCTLLCYTLLQKPALQVLMVMGPDHVLERGHELERLEILRFQPPSKRLMKIVLGLPNFVHPPDFVGMKNVDPSRPSLFVANHTLFGIDMAPLGNGVYQETGVFLRGLADHIHFGFPHTPLMRWVGAVDGTRVNTEFLMKTKQNILVYPGGQREVLKHSGIKKYSLMWQDRMGFARLAIKHGYPIVPVASVGVEDMIDILMDLPIRGMKLPFPKPVSPFRLQKIYYWIGEPIPTSHYNGDWENQDIVRRVRDETKVAIETGIETLLKNQMNDPERYLTQQARARIKSWVADLGERVGM